MRVDALDDLAVELHDQPEDAVRRRVLRAEVDGVIVDLLVAGVARMAESSPPRRRRRRSTSLRGRPRGRCQLQPSGGRAGCGCRCTLRPASGSRALADFARGLLARLAGLPWPPCATGWPPRPGRSGGFDVLWRWPTRRRRRRWRARSFAGRLLVAREPIFRPFPRHQEIEAPEVLRKRDRLIDHALLGFGVAQLDMAGQREVLALRIAFEAIVGEDPAQVRIAGKADAIHVEDFALEPAGDRPQRRDTRYRRRLVGRDLDPDAPVPGQRQQAINDLEPLRRDPESRRRQSPSAADIRVPAVAQLPRRTSAMRLALERPA